MKRLGAGLTEGVGFECFACVFKRGEYIASYLVGDWDKVEAVRASYKGCIVEVFPIRKQREASTPDAGYTERSRNGRPYANRLLCVETGEIWESVQACAEALGLGVKNIYESTRTGWAAGGRHFKLIGHGRD